MTSRKQLESSIRNLRKQIDQVINNEALEGDGGGSPERICESWCYLSFTIWDMQLRIIRSKFPWAVRDRRK